MTFFACRDLGKVLVGFENDDRKGSGDSWNVDSVDGNLAREKKEIMR